MTRRTTLLGTTLVTALGTALATTTAAAVATAAPVTAGDTVAPDHGAATVHVTRITGDAPSTARDVNRHGTVVGGVVLDVSDPHLVAYTWTRGRLRLLDAPDAGEYAEAVRVNRRGDVLVQTRRGARLLVGHHWRRFPDTAAVDLNEAGEALLYTPYIQDLAVPTRALLWTRGRLVELRPPGIPPGWHVYPGDLDDAGRVLLLAADLAGSGSRSYVWTRGTFVELRPAAPDAGVQARLLDGHGGAIGSSAGAVRWDASGRAVPLPLPDDATGSDARDVNRRGQIVGYTAYPDGDQRITVWTAGRPAVLPDIPDHEPVGDSPVIDHRGRVAWTERADADGFTPLALAWWDGRLVRLGEGVVQGIDVGGDVIGEVQPGGNGTFTFALHWSVRWHGRQWPPSR
jgi:hypothetical protein